MTLTNFIIAHKSIAITMIKAAQYIQFTYSGL